MTNGLLWAHRRESLSAPGLVLLLFYMLVLFQYPFDFLILFDIAVVYVVVLLAITLGASQPFPMPLPATGCLLRTSTDLVLHGPKGFFRGPCRNDPLTTDT